MSTSTKAPQTIRQGGPGASHQNAKAPLEIRKPAAEEDRRRHARISGGGGERDSHHSHDPERKGGGSHPAQGADAGRDDGQKPKLRNLRLG